MVFHKKNALTLPFCYAVSKVRQQGETRILFAPDAPGPCISVSEDLSDKQVLWDDNGGSMSMIEIPGKEDEFLAIQQFNPPFKAEGALVAHVRLIDGEWQSEPLFPLPFIHRFDFIHRGDTHYLICCTLCSEKENLEDWSSSGDIYVAEIGDSPLSELELRPIAPVPMRRNHGFLKKDHGNYSSVYVSSDAGIYEVTPPDTDDSWSCEQVLPNPTSDLAFCDIDDDGIEELITIGGFHGDRIVIYKPIEGHYEEIYRYTEGLGFCHVIWGGKLRGKNTVIAGCRAETKKLFTIHFSNDNFTILTIDEQQGPSNIMVENHEDFDAIYCANREIGEAAVYHVHEE